MILCMIPIQCFILKYLFIGKWAIFIFSKLFIGMYIAFLVSFVALFINVEYDEPRFGLPVGGLFATIANKYIIEGSLPHSRFFAC